MEAVSYLKGDAREPRLHAVTKGLCAQALLLGNLEADLASAETRVETALDSGDAAVAFDRMVADAAAVQGVVRADVATGDRLVVYTRNSVYTLRRLADGAFEVTGGWFDRSTDGRAVLTVTGCTWGGSAVRRDLVAGCGMRIEFGNRVITSIVQRVVHYPSEHLN